MYNFIRVFLAGVLCACLLLAEKAFFTDIQLQSGAFLTETVIAIAPKQSVAYQSVMESEGNLQRIKNTLEHSETFDFAKLVRNWRQLSESEKIRWLRQHSRLFINNGEVYTLVFYMNKDEVTDVAFLEKQGHFLTNTITQETLQTIKLLKPEVHVSVLNTRLLYPKEPVFTKYTVLKKYGIIGFGLGGILAVAVIGFKWIVKRLTIIN